MLSPHLRGFKRVTVQVKVSVDDGEPVVFECSEDRGLMDVRFSGESAEQAKRYTRWMMGCVEGQMLPAMQHALELSESPFAGPVTTHDQLSPLEAEILSLRAELANSRTAEGIARELLAMKKGDHDKDKPLAPATDQL